jgi:hypothetical protein
LIWQDQTLLRPFAGCRSTQTTGTNWTGEHAWLRPHPNQIGNEEYRGANVFGKNRALLALISNLKNHLNPQGKIHAEKRQNSQPKQAQTMP